jgi:lambda family phage portal protein
VRLRGVEVKKNLVDRAVEYFNPIEGRRRLQARVQLAIAGQWVGARKDRQATKDWNPFGGSADEDNLNDLPDMRSRSRDLQRRDPQALGATNTTVTSVVGTGLSLRARPDAKTLRMTPEAAKEWRATTESKFCAWAGSAIACDLEATLDLYQLQALALRSALDSGDVIALLPMKQRRASRYKLKVHIVEADRLCNKDHASDTDVLTAGVERDAEGMPLNYHIAKRHPGALTGYKATEWDVVPAFGALTGRRNVIHLFDKRRPGQSRGVPYLAPVIETLKQISDYTYAELQSAVIAAAFTVFIESESGTGLDLDDAGAPQSTATPSGGDIGLRPGAIVDLAKGEKATFANPGRPNSSADVFLQAMLRRVGVALELPYEILVKHFTASYSAARAALLEAWRFFKGRRAWLAAMFLQPIYEAWLEEAIALGDIVAPGFFDDPLMRAAWCGAEWIGDAPGQIDPLKEIDAAAKRLETLLSTRGDEAMELRGADWDDVIERLAMEQRSIEAAGLKPAASAASDALPTATPEESRPDKSDEEIE